jgi:predicted transcriptional regulator
MLKIFELMDLINIEEPEESPQLDSIGSKVWYMIDKNFPLGKFTSSEILEKYEDEYGEPIKLSIISTYLSRFATKGKIVRERQGREWAYQVIKLAQKQRNLGT